jgi:hypothetical protein
MASLPFENFAAMPHQVLGGGMPFRALGLSYRQTVVTHQAILKATATVGLLGDEKATGRLQGERSQIEQFMMQHAQRQPRSVIQTTTSAGPLNEALNKYCRWWIDADPVHEIPITEGQFQLRRSQASETPSAKPDPLSEKENRPWWRFWS